MSKVAKYRRQVSEDPDIDNLLSTLSPEEMEELEKELDVVDADGSIPPEPGQKSQTGNSSAGPQNCEETTETTLNHHEKEGRRRIQREQAIDVSRVPSGGCSAAKGSSVLRPGAEMESTNPSGAG